MGSNSAAFSPGFFGARFISASFPDSNAKCACWQTGRSNYSSRATSCKRSTSIRRPKNRPHEIARLLPAHRRHRRGARRRRAFLSWPGAGARCGFRRMLRTSDAFPRDYTRRRSLVRLVFFAPALARWTGWTPAEIYVEHFDGNVAHGPRALCRTGRLPSTFRRAAGFGARRVFDEETRSAFGRAAFQSLSRTRRWRRRRHRRRLGFRAMDGESAFLSTDCRARRFRVSQRREIAALPFCRGHWRDVRLAFPTRRSRLRIERWLGPYLRHLLVVPRAAHAQVTIAGTKARLVSGTRPRTVRLAHRSHRLWFDRRHNLRRA